MSVKNLSCGLAFVLGVSAAYAPLAEAADKKETKSAAREALAKKEGDADAEKALEEVFQAAENNYSLLKKGGTSLNYSFSFSYFGDQAIDLEVDNSSLRSVNVSPSANHTFTNAFTFDYGVKDNVTASVTIPLVAKFETQNDLESYGMGDMSFSIRWQPWSVVPGELNKTLFATFSTATGDSPYDIIVDQELSTGSGYYSMGFGGSVSKVLDPVVLFGSLNYSHNFAVEDLQQVRGSRILEAVEPGDSYSVSAGFAYSLSYDVSLTASVQGSFTQATTFDFKDTTRVVEVGTDDEPEQRIIVDNNKSELGEQFSGVMSFALGVRVSPTTIVNVNTGFGLTEDSPDMLVGFSMPLDISGLKSFGEE
ncbi:transporter [Litoribacillus peritrichatus]|uniref:Transporter n=1 Tax=Litoribacillus peritrichatus TaxID=718191 RepID=A0ABP7LXL0_9GAMM